MSPQPILLQILLRQRQWHRYGIFRAAYDDAARQLDRGLVGTAPSRAQLHRWTSGELKRLPYTDHCRVLEIMFPGWTADELFGPCPDDVMADPSRPKGGPFARCSGSDLLSHPVTRAVPSALVSLTTGFEMGPGGPSRL